MRLLVVVYEVLDELGCASRQNFGQVGYPVFELLTP